MSRLADLRKKELTCPIGSCQCCCQPKIEYKFGDGSALGSADVPFFCCLPKISVKECVRPHPEWPHPEAHTHTHTRHALSGGAHSILLPPPPSRRSAAGAEKYIVQMPSCMGGVCVDCMAEGCCNCKIPFYIYPTGSAGGKGEEVGKVVKMWRGMGTEVFSDAASFQLDFPKEADAPSKAMLLGTTMFINMLFFEKGNE